MSRTTLAGCHALLGAEATPTTAPVDIVIDGRRIADIRPTGRLPSAGPVIDATDRLVTPGLINGHLHSHEHFQKGRFDNLPLELWVSYVRPPDGMELTTREVYLRTMIGAIEALRSGTTTLIDDLNVSPVLKAEHVEAVLEAYADIGIRALVGLSLFDRPFFRWLPFVDEELPRDLLAELESRPKPDPSEAIALARHLASARHPARERVGYICTPSAPQRCSEPFLRATRALADEFGVPAMIHVQETRLQVVTGQRLFGCTPVEHLARLGFLKPNTALVHATWLTPREVDLIAASGATVQHNPVSNLKLASGLAPVAPLLAAGVNVSLGSDGCASNDSASLLHVLRAGALLGKLRGDRPEQWVGAREMWRAATLGGATALGMAADLGVVETGRIADLAVWRLDRVPFVPLNDAVQQLVYCENGGSLDMVFVDGECVVRGGALEKIDEPALLAEIREAHTRLRSRIEQNERGTAGRLQDAYRRIYERSLSEAIAGDTFPAKLAGEAPAKPPCEAGS